MRCELARSRGGCRAATSKTVVAWHVTDNVSKHGGSLTPSGFAHHREWVLSPDRIQSPQSRPASSARSGCR